MKIVDYLGREKKPIKRYEYDKRIKQLENALIKNKIISKDQVEISIIKSNLEEGHSE